MENVSEPKIKQDNLATKNAARLISKRFTVVLLVLLITSLALYNKLLPAEVFQTIVIWLSGIYVVGKPAGDMINEYFAAK